jgi:hypothetical protein
MAVNLYQTTWCNILEDIIRFTVWGTEEERLSKLDEVGF